MYNDAGRATHQKDIEVGVLDVVGFGVRAEMSELNFETVKITAIVNMYNDAGRATHQKEIEV